MYFFDPVLMKSTVTVKFNKLFFDTDMCNKFRRLMLEFIELISHPRYEKLCNEPYDYSSINASIGP